MAEVTAEVPRAARLTVTAPARDPMAKGSTPGSGTLVSRRAAFMFSRAATIMPDSGIRENDMGWEWKGRVTGCTAATGTTVCAGGTACGSRPCLLPSTKELGRQGLPMDMESKFTPTQVGHFEAIYFGNG